MRFVLMTDELFEALGASRVEWGEPDDQGFYTPTVYADLPAAAIRLVRAYDANVDAVNGGGHKGTPHDQALHFDPCMSDPEVHVYSDSTDCAACGGAQYGAESEVQAAVVALKRALGEPLRPYEEAQFPAVPAMTTKQGARTRRRRKETA